jgi:hypothetical protein
MKSKPEESPGRRPTPQDRGAPAFSGFWFKVPVELDILTELKPAELKVYLAVIRAIQRDRNGGLLAMSQIATRANLSTHHARDAVYSLCQRRLLTRVNPVTGLELTDKEEWNGRMVTYGNPIQWIQRDAGNLPPTGERSNPSHSASSSDDSASGPEPAQESDLAPEGESNLTPVGERHLTPVGERHSESSEFSEVRSPTSGSASSFDFGFKPANCDERITGNASEKPPMRSQAGGRAAGGTAEDQTPEEADTADDEPELVGEGEPPLKEPRPKHRWTALDEANLAKRLSAFMDGDEAPQKLVRWVVDDLSQNYDVSPADVYEALESAWNRRAAPGQRNSPRSWNWFYEVLRAAVVPGYAARLPEAATAPQEIRPEELSRGIDAIELPDIPICQEQLVDSYATAIHARHPPSRSCLLSEVKCLLGRIAGSVSVSEQAPLLQRVDDSHIAHCASSQWQTEGGRYVMGLRNWLEPSMKRWEGNPAPGAAATLGYTAPENLATPERQAAERERRRQEGMFLRESERTQPAPGADVAQAALQPGTNRNRPVVAYADAS